MSAVAEARVENRPRRLRRERRERRWGMIGDARHGRVLASVMISVTVRFNGQERGMVALSP